ncbi:MAG: phosphofructokinase [Chloroflexi bacterium]|nr:phosphofructokinase [Chloroflexota bacterium]
MRIGILTGGGDVPGLNPAIKTLVQRALDSGHEALGIRRGWHGLLYYNPEDPTSFDEHILPLNKRVVRTIDRTGGTFLHTSRTNPSKVPVDGAPDFLKSGLTGQQGPVDLTAHVLKVLDSLEIDVLVPIGGEDTLGYGARIHREGFPVVALPKTMDNDIPGTDYCIGFSTAITLSVHAINQIRSAVGSHERIGVVELFGRHSGATSLVAGYLSGADRVIISEVPFDTQRLAEFLVVDRAENPSHYAIMTISEGAQEVEGDVVQVGEADMFGHRKLGGIGSETADKIKRLTGVNTSFQQLGYLMRSGPPDALDLMVASNYANLALDLINERKFGYMVALKDGKYTYISADSPSAGARSIDVDEFYDVEAYRPKMKQILNKPMYLY